MAIRIEDLTPKQIVEVYNKYAATPVKRFENREKAQRRVRALLAAANVNMATAIADALPLPADPDWTPADVGYGDKIEDDERKAHEAEADAIFAKIETRKARRQRLASAPTAPEPVPASAPAPAVTGKARTVIVAACSRPEGATSEELFAATGWKYASWSHQLKLAAAQTGWTPEIRRYAGTARYFLHAPAV